MAGEAGRARGGGSDRGAGGPARAASPPPAKRPRLVWTQALHQRVVEVVEELGGSKAAPKSITQHVSVGTGDSDLCEGAAKNPRVEREELMESLRQHALSLADEVEAPAEASSPPPPQKLLQRASRASFGDAVWDALEELEEREEQAPVPPSSTAESLQVSASSKPEGLVREQVASAPPAATGNRFGARGFMRGWSLSDQEHFYQPKSSEGGAAPARPAEPPSPAPDHVVGPGFWANVPPGPEARAAAESIAASISRILAREAASRARRARPPAHPWDHYL